jgi:hypothetical protein
MTHRQDLEAPHDPSHRLVKVRTPVLTRQHGRVYTAAQNAFTKVEKFCTMIAEASQQPEKQEQTVPDAEAASSPEDVPSETPPKDDDKKPENLAENGPAAPEDTTRGAEGVDEKHQEQEKETSQSAERTQTQDSDNIIPSCGNCKGPLSFPCWYCVKCEGQLSSDALHILGAVS